MRVNDLRPIKPKSPLRFAAWVGLLCALAFSPAQAAPFSSFSLRPSTSNLPSSLEPAPCWFSAPSDYVIECGYVSVPEDRAQPSRRTIRLAVAVVKSRNEQLPAPDPVVFLHGGPAVPILFQLPQGLLAVFKPLLVSRDVIFFDQRGVGYSEPSLGCPEFTAYSLEAARQNLLPDERQAQLLEAVAACRVRLAEASVDLTQYTSAISAADVADLRTALGYAEWNIYAASYGTRVALEVLRAYPAGVRSVILDSPVPPQANLLENMPGDIQQGFEDLFQSCAADWGCRLAYPNLKDVFYAEVERLNAQPVSVTLPSGSSPAATYRLSGNDLIDTLYNGLLSPALRPFLPALLYDAQEGHYEKFAQLRALNQRLGEQFALGAYLSATCSEEVPFNSLTLQASLHPLFQDYLARYRTFNGFFIQTLCRAWPAQPSAATASLAVASGVPALIFAGALDPLTPPAQARLTAATLSRSFLYEFPGLSHGVLASACPMRMAAGFLNHPTQAPEARCLSQLDARPGFFIRAEAARLPAQLLIGLLSLSLSTVLLRSRFSLRPSAVSLQSAWFAFRSTHRLGPLLGLAVTLFFLVVGDPGGAAFLQRTRLVATVWPLVAGLQAASLFSPEDEPALEVTLACPRPLAWTLLERLAVLLGVQGGLALVGGLLISALTGEAPGLALMRWLPPMLCLAAVALCLTLNSRQAIFSAGATVLLWFGFVWGGDRLVERWPWLWPLHLYLQPEQPFFWLNRALLIMLGLNLLAFALLYLIRDEERVLFGNLQARGAKLKAREAGPASPAPVQPFPAFRVQNSAGLQFFALLRYEFLLHWRRRVLPVFFLASLTLPLLGVFLARLQVSDLSQFVLPPADLAPEAARQASTTSLLMLTWAPLFVVLLVLLPPAVAETVPRDQQLGVRELLRALPLSPGAYLGGKLLGLWGSLLAGIVGVLSLVGAVWWLAVGPFDLGLYLQLLALGAFPVAALNSGLSLLLAANQPNRRRAIFVGLAFCIFCLGALTVSFNSDPGSPSAWLWKLLNPSRVALFNYFLWGWAGAASPAVNNSTWADVAGDLGTGLAQLAAVGLVAWGWLRWREAA